MALVGLIVWVIGRYAARNLVNFSWPQEFAVLFTNVGLIIIGTAVVAFFWGLMRPDPVES